ncbi:MAG: peptide transporter [Eubacteriales bacterium]|nr:peptide transporter [Eubacteriales bacterium]
MKDFLDLTGLTPGALGELFALADRVKSGACSAALRGKYVVLFFPASSLRTRVSYERAVGQLGGQGILFPPETLDKREDLADVAGYLANWADAAVIRHPDLALLRRFATQAPFPVINAMTRTNHPCEILSDLYALSRLRKDFLQADYLFVGPPGNIAASWKEAADALGLHLRQCCPPGWELPGVPVSHSLREAIASADVVCTDSLPPAAREAFAPFRITRELMEQARPGALLNPCPPFFRGEEIAADAVQSDFFVGYSFKSCLAEIQAAVLLRCLGIA